MPAQARLADRRKLHSFWTSPVRIGVVVGAALSAVLTVWLYMPSHVSVFDEISAGPNLAAAMRMFFLASIPVLRFLRQPDSLIISSLIAWSILSLTYRTLCLFFWTLGDWHSTFQIFMLGAVLYLIVATISWLGACLWKARAEHTSHSGHHVR